MSAQSPSPQRQDALLKRQALFWLAALVAFGVFFYVFSSILLPFLVGMAIAYFLDPVADWLEKRGFNRLMATITILLGFVIVFVTALIILIPILFNQFNDFIQKLPDYIERFHNFVLTAQADYLPRWAKNQVGNIRNNFSGFLSQGMSFMAGVFAQIWNSGKAIMNVVSLAIVTPVVAFYMLLDWDKMIVKVDAWVPRDHVNNVRQIARDMDKAMAGFIRGQGSLCLILGIYYAAGLSIIGLNFGLLIGIFAGLISFIPYVGSTLGLLLATGVALVQFPPEYTYVIIVVLFFLSGQFLEGNFLQPRLVGSSIGIHPVWLMFALLAFGFIFGFIGLLVAVPLAAAMGVLVRFALARYLQSHIYYGDHYHSSIELQTGDDHPVQDHGN